MCWSDYLFTKCERLRGRDWDVQTQGIRKRMHHCVAWRVRIEFNNVIYVRAYFHDERWRSCHTRDWRSQQHKQDTFAAGSRPSLRPDCVRAYDVITAGLQYITMPALHLVLRHPTLLPSSPPFTSLSSSPSHSPLPTIPHSLHSLPSFLSFPYPPSPFSPTLLSVPSFNYPPLPFLLWSYRSAVNLPSGSHRSTGARFKTILVHLNSKSMHYLHHKLNFYLLFCNKVIVLADK